LERQHDDRRRIGNGGRLGRWSGFDRHAAAFDRWGLDDGSGRSAPIVADPAYEGIGLRLRPGAEFARERLAQLLVLAKSGAVPALSA